MQTTSELGRFVEGFRDEHRDARDILGAHIRYEEETIYPALESFFGPDYVEKMLQDHDRMLGVAGRLMELAGHAPITDQDAAEAERLVQGQLPHVSDCDGLAIIIEALSEDKQKAIAESRDRCITEGLTVMEWSERRGRAPIPPG